MNILAFGVTGFVGGCLVPHLVERGHAVTVAARSGRARFGVDVPVIAADPTQPGPWQEQVAISNKTGLLLQARSFGRESPHGRAAIVPMTRWLRLRWIARRGHAVDHTGDMT